MACGNLFALGCLRHTSPIVILISDDLGDLMSRIAVPALALSLALGLPLGLGLTACNRQQQQHPSRTPRLDGAGEARLIARRCGEPPTGHARWSLRLLADQAVALDIVEAISHETVRQTRKKCVETASAENAGHSAQAQWRICSAYGRCLRGLADAI